jgi:hypothetical protein
MWYSGQEIYNFYLTGFWFGYRLETKMVKKNFRSVCTIFLLKTGFPRLLHLTFQPKCSCKVVIDFYLSFLSQII